MIILLLKIQIKIYVVVSSSFDAESEHSHEAGDENDRIEYFGHFGEFEGKTSRIETRRVAWSDWGMTVLLYWEFLEFDSGTDMLSLQILNECTIMNL